MGHLNYEFFDEFKTLDNLCRDIYGETADKKLGVTLYLEDMERQSYRGSIRVSGWTADYNKLKSARNIRNDLAHSRNSFSNDICSTDDIAFIRAFRLRILNQTDPIALLRKQTEQKRTPTKPHPTPPHTAAPSPAPRPTVPRQAPTTYTPSKANAGCLGIVATFLIAVACLISFLF